MLFKDWVLKNSAFRSSAAAVEKLLSLHDEGKNLSYVLQFESEAQRLDTELCRAFFAELPIYQRLMAKKQELLDLFPEDTSLPKEIAAILQQSRDEESLELGLKSLKRRRKSKAFRALELGLDQVFQQLWSTVQTGAAGSEGWESLLGSVVNDKGAKDLMEARSLLAALIQDKLAHDEVLLEDLREHTRAQAVLRATKSEKATADSKFNNFFSFQEKLHQLVRAEQATRYLTLRRGAAQGDINLHLDLDLSRVHKLFEEKAVPSKNRAALDPTLVEFFLQNAREALQQIAWPQVSKEVQAEVKSYADEEALKPIRKNYRKVLMTPALGRKCVMGVCPSGKKYAKLAVVDREGQVLESAVVAFQDQVKGQESEAVFLALIEKHKVEAVVIGMQLGGREIERYIQGLFRNIKLRLPLVLLPNEASDTYGSSPLAMDELPDLDNAGRKAVFLARQLQNPLTELVKVKARGMGVGQFLNEIHPDRLNDAVEDIAVDLLHAVGVDLNSSSAYVLSKICGLNDIKAQAIVHYRKEKGFFWDRDQALEVPSIEAKDFELSGPFLRIRDGKNLLDTSFVHPKYNQILWDAAKRLRFEKHELNSENTPALLEDEKVKAQIPEAARAEILAVLRNPPSDLRGEFKNYQFREDVNSLHDLKIGMVCTGRVSNVTPFGAFVDVGLPQDGLVHLSELSGRFVKDPFEILQAGDWVSVKVLSVDPERKQISFSMKNLENVSTKNQEILKRHAAHVAAEKPAEPRAPRPDRAPRPQQARNDRPQRNPDSQGPRRNHNEDRRPPQNARPSQAPMPPRKPKAVEGLKDNPFAALANLKAQLPKS